MHRPIARREALKLLGGSSAALLTAGMAARALAEVPLGGGQLTTVSDGHLVLPLDFAYPDAPRDEVVSLLTAAGLPDDRIEPPCNVTVYRDGDRVVVFDVGAGPNFMASAGLLADNLEAAGVAPEDVTHVLFTHAHPDHIWGLLDDFDEPVFANAEFHINRAEWDFWRAEETLDTMPEARKTFVVGARNRFAALEDVINLFDYGAEVLPGIEAVDTSGHTPGHTSFAIHSGGASAMVLGDAVTNAAVSFARPDWPSGSDQDVEKGIATRRAVLDRLAGDQGPIVGFHLPGNGIGRVETAGTGYRFVPA
ncbi:MBL fold metallo-hydrolase [Oricola sp.]|uniref:MBL fold metallo-hydrolase n=1 Tax=Oricola sp. TaxID=1979950 RepID=UPI003BA954FC